MIQDERVRLAKPTSEAPSSAIVGFVARTRASFDNFDDKGEKIDKSTLYYTHCKKSGHLAKTCFEIIGYPDWWPNQSKIHGTGRGKSSFSGGQGCESTRASAAITSGRGQNTPASSPSTALDSSSTGFTAEQWKALASIIGKTKISADRQSGKFDYNLWIIDSGENRHITCIDSWLFDITTISPYYVGLPNGHTAQTSHEGSIRLSSNLVLHNVLYVPDLCCNLIFVSRLIDDNNYTIHFNSQMCIIQD